MAGIEIVEEGVHDWAAEEPRKSVEIGWRQAHRRTPTFEIRRAMYVLHQSSRKHEAISTGRSSTGTWKRIRQDLQAKMVRLMKTSMVLKGSLVRQFFLCLKCAVEDLLLNYSKLSSNAVLTTSIPCTTNTWLGTEPSVASGRPAAINGRGVVSAVALVPLYVQSHRILAQNSPGPRRCRNYLPRPAPRVRVVLLGLVHLIVIALRLRDLATDVHLVNSLRFIHKFTSSV